MLEVEIRDDPEEAVSLGVATEPDPAIDEPEPDEFSLLPSARLFRGPERVKNSCIEFFCASRVAPDLSADRVL
ncbi:hypothetical protein [Microbacterium sp.]|uniref:hypothetical protein n=1 Tax=Microbacterium sp. TaxID=51671 RepID=UPI002FDF343E